jgi:hypothetical protein
VNGFQDNSPMLFRLDAETSRLRGESAVTWRQICRRFPVHRQPGHGVIVSPFQEQSSPITQQTIFRSHSKGGEHAGKQRTLLGWNISVLLHGLVLTVVAVLNLHMTSPRVTPQKEAFHWDVSLVSAPKTEPVVADGMQSQEAFQAEEIYPEETGVRVADSSTQSVESMQQAEIVQTVSSSDSPLPGPSRLSCPLLKSRTRQIRNYFNLRRNWKILLCFNAPKA